MFKKIASLVLAVLMIASLSATLASCSGDSSFKVGVILIGDETEGYTKAHMDGIKAAASALKLSDSQIIWKYKVEENDSCTKAAQDLVAQGCKVIFSNSYGHQDYIAPVAAQYPDITFVSMTGDYAAISGLSNFKNAFTSIYEARYVAGIVAGCKLKELVENGTLTKEKLPNSFDANGNIKIGYVGAFDYAEVISGYTAFFLGIQNIVSNVAMDVVYTDSWFDIELEGAAAEALIARGCVIIGQHADSTGAPAAAQKAKDAGALVYSIGYNIDMLPTAPTAALTSPTNEWNVYYTYAIKAAMDGSEIAVDWAHGFADGAVAITALGPECAADTQAKVDETIAALKAGTLHVFDTSKFTVDGKKVESNIVDLSYMDWTTMTPIYVGDKVETITNGYFSESTFRSAPYFTLRIDGITEQKDRIKK